MNGDDDGYTTLIGGGNHAIIVYGDAIHGLGFFARA